MSAVDEQAPESRVAPPVRCETLAEIARREGGDIVASSGGGAVVAYAAPTRADDETSAYLRGLSELRSPGAMLACLRGGRLTADGVVISADGESIARDVSVDFGKPFGRHWLIGGGPLRAPEVLPGSTAVAAVHLGAGYCHWLLEELPRLLRIERGLADNLIAHAETAFAREALALRGGRERVVSPRRRAHFACSRLWVPGLAAKAGEPTPEAVDAIRDFTASVGRGLAGAGERIYVSRSGARRRRVANEDELLRMLEQLGFRALRLEDMEWAEQIAAFRAARVVVGPHGAGLANLAFCAPGARVVELVNRAYFNPTFWRVAALRGLDYRPLVSAAGDAEAGPIREERRANRLDIVADAAAVRAALAD